MTQRLLPLSLGSAFRHGTLLLAFTTLAGCGNDPASSPWTATGGVPATGQGGSTAASGGSATTGGVGQAGSSSGGQATGGSPVTTGGATGSGGAPATGGTSTASTSGGTSSTGPSGGSAGAGGSPMGGTSAQAGGGGKAGGNGGMSSDGGRTSSGGAGGAGAGGASPTGGSGGGGSQTCPTPGLKAGDTTKTIQVGSKSRTYVLHVPSAYDGSKAVPLVVDFHPLGGSGPNERSSSPYPAQTDSEGVIMAFPSGEKGPSGGAWNVGPCCVANVDDVAFAKALVEDVKKSACIDSKRIYAVGFSMGGGMSHYLACHAADVFAAVAPAAFDLAKENVDACKPARPLTVVAFRGTSDPIVSYAGGYSSVVQGMPITFLGAKATFEKWSQLNQCTGSPSAEDGKGCSTYSTCKDGVQVTLCTKQGGGHEAGNASVAWPILKKYTMP
ncbi:MAG TPA: PHB depolymerase family esterase [Polyangiaceae bacterium]|nr:PHB depolymerase family esterase [Polyangiaceae bacterium]